MNIAIFIVNCILRQSLCENIFLLKGTVNVISRGLQLIKWYVRRYTKALPDQIWIRYSFFIFSSDYFHLWFLCKSDLRFSSFRNNKNLLDFNTCIKTMLSFYLIRLRFQGYGCEPCIVPYKCNYSSLNLLSVLCCLDTMC